VHKAKRQFQLLSPIAGVVFLTVMALIGSLWVVTQQIDKASRTREEALMRRGLTQLAADHATLMTPMTIWDQAVRSTSVKYDPQWVNDNIGTYFNKYLNFESSYLMNAEGEIVTAFVNGKMVAQNDFGALNIQAIDVVSKIRLDYVAARSRGETLSALSDSGGRFVAIKGQLYILGASLILPDGKDEKLYDYPPFAAIGTHAISTSELLTLSKRYMVSKLQVAHTGAAIPDGAATIDFHDENGKDFVTLYWIPQRPGYTLFMASIGPMIMFAFLLTLFSMCLMLRSHKVAQNLLDSESRARHMATHDALTGLPNRAIITDRFMQISEKLKRGGTPMAIMSVGIDRFKEVNDTLGHKSGDELIMLTSKHLSALIRSCDTLGRINGNEFVIIQPDTDANGAAALAKRICNALKGTVSLENGSVFSSCSIGITMISSAAIDSAEAIRQADLALFRAKSSERGQYVFFEPEMDATVKLRKSMEAGLRDAIENNKLSVVYQPQVDYNGRLVGVEALCRWTHPTRGPVSPSYFIPLAEDCGMMVSLGRIIMRQAFKDAQNWPGLKVAVNVSVAQLKEPGFLDEIKELMAEARVCAAQIELEITEGMLMGDDMQTQTMLANLRALGFSLALDDFGTGYSSLSYLNRYPVDKIKIDRSFIAKLGEDPESEALIKAIVKLSKALNLKIIAEGVETLQQRQVLHQAGCNTYQGYGFSKPTTACEISSLIGANCTMKMAETKPSHVQAA
jgi:diguanylate cyclase (GGDEF)-like protein